eukprot:NODE_22_length_42145_cov_1.310612.p33 type:complete len:117 gc:universal NODE_22_length_42145_cov_1.310612:40622-40972(+)
MYLPYNDIAHVSFSRVSASGSNSSRTFDISVNLKAGQQILFSNIGREEHSSILKFLQTKNIEVFEEQEEEVVETFNEEEAVPMDLDEDESSPDEDFNPGKLSSEESVAEEESEAND